VAAASADIPTAVASKPAGQWWSARGDSLDAVLCRSWPRSPCVDPHDHPPATFAVLPGLMPSVLWLEFRAEAGQDAYDRCAPYRLRRPSRRALQADVASLAPKPQPSPAPRSHAQAEPQARSAIGLTGQARIRCDFGNPHPGP